MAGGGKFDFKMNNVVPGTYRWVAFMRFFQIFACIVILILVSYSVGYYGHWWGGGSLGFAIFTCIWSLIFLLSIIITPIILPFLYFKFLALLAECITWIFWLAAWAGLASWSATYNGDFDGYGYHGTAWACVTVAAIFAAFTWLMFSATLFTFSVAVHRYRMESNDVELAATAPVAEGSTAPEPVQPQQVPV